MPNGKAKHAEDVSKSKTKAEDNFKSKAKKFQDNAGIKPVPADLLPASEISKVLVDFLNDKGIYPDFLDFIGGQGYKPAEFGIEEE